MSGEPGRLPATVALRRRVLDRAGPVGRALRSVRRRPGAGAAPVGDAARDDAIAMRLDDVVARLDDIGRELVARRADRAALDDIGRELVARRADRAALDDIGRELVARRGDRVALDDLDRRLRATQAMVARTYEHAQGWPQLLAAIRARAGYDAPYGTDPLVSVTIPTYNRSQTLCDRALRSLRRQTYERWEAIVVGDCCTDDTEARVRALGDDRIRFENLPVRGPYPDHVDEAILVYGAPATQRAIELARGDWIAALDDDDEWDDDHLELLLDEARRTRAEVVYGKWRMRVASNGRVIARDFGEWPLRIEQFAFQAAIYHAALGALGHDMNGRFAGEAGDWNRARRLWEAGVRFAFLDRVVTTIWFTARNDHAVRALAWLTDTVGYEDDARDADPPTA